MSTSTLLTEKDFLDLPDEPGKQELLDGELLHVPPATHSHNQLAKRLVRILETVLDPSRVHKEEAYRLRAGRWLIPDVSVSWADQRLQDDWFQGSPELAIEVASAGNTPEQLERKVNMHLADGCSEVWVIYPKLHSMVVSRPGSMLRVAPDADYHCELAGVGVTITPEDRKA